jgi:hypothetical protein
MPCAFARIRTSFSCTSICRLVASASCQLPVGIEKWSVVSSGCQWRPDQQLSVPAPGEALEADTLFPTDDWQLPLDWPTAFGNSSALIPTETGILRPDPTDNCELTLTTPPGNFSAPIPLATGNWH